MSNYVSLQYYFKIIQYIEIHNMKNFRDYSAGHLFIRKASAVSAFLGKE